MEKNYCRPAESKAILYLTGDTKEGFMEEGDGSWAF